MEWLLPHLGVMLGLGECQTEHRHVQQINREHCHDGHLFHHAKSRQEKLRTRAGFTYQAGSWTRPRKVAARLECSLRPDRAHA